MTIVANILIGLVALLHTYFLILEMFLWDKPQGHKTFGLTAEFATASKNLAANQGLYNGFLAAGLIWGLLLGTAGQHIQIFFLACVIIAGLYGGWTVSKKIMMVQAVPATLALLFVLLA